MKAISLAIAALILCSVQNIIIERKLANISPLVYMALSQLVILSLALSTLFFYRKLDPNLTMPQGNQYWFLAICGVLIFFSGLCFFGAYHSGGSLIIITTILSLIPLLASFLKFSMGGGSPSGTQILGYFFALIAVILISK